LFDRVLIVDWSATNGPTRPGPNTIWIGSADDTGVSARHMPTRTSAEAHLAGQIAESRGSGLRLLMGVDFAFGYPRGFARHLTGRACARSLWRHLAERIVESPDHHTNRFAVAREINRSFGGRGPFWVVNEGLSHPDLPFGKKDRDDPARHGIASHRAVEGHPQARGAKSVWQLTGPGSVGSQSLTGLPMIHRLSLLPGVTVWPFDTDLSDVVLAEIYPALLAPAVAAEVASGWIADAAQVRLLALALWRLARNDGLAGMLNQPDAEPEEGWILGVGHRDLLAGAVP
jgi:hypothetical protein